RSLAFARSVHRAGERSTGRSAAHRAHGADRAGRRSPILKPGGCMNSGTEPREHLGFEILLTPDDVVKILGLNRVAQLYELIRPSARCPLKAVRCGKYLRFKPSVLARWLEENAGAHAPGANWRGGRSTWRRSGRETCDGDRRLPLRRHGIRRRQPAKPRR